MKKLMLVLPLLASVCLDASSRDYRCLDHHVNLGVDWGYMRRSEIRGLPLAKDDFVSIDADNQTVLNTDDLVHDFNWESAIRADFIYMRNEKVSLELVYIYYFPWEGTKTVESDGTLFFPFKDLKTIDYVNADRAEAKYRSWVQNAELNYWGHASPRLVDYFSFSWLIGARFFYIKENFDLAFTRGPETSDYLVGTKNFLYGLQLGWLFEVNPSSRWTWSIDLRGAGFLNDGRQTTFVGDEGNEVVLADYTKDQWQGSWLLEGIGKITYRWTTYFHIFAGYQAFLLSGLALAPPQRDVDLTAGRRIDNSGQIVLDGFFAGINFSF